MIIQGLTLNGGFQLDPPIAPTPSGLSKFVVVDNYDPGSVNVFDADGSNQVIITNPTGDSNDNFGDAAIAINTTKVAVGANSTRGAGNQELGAVYLFNHDGTGEQKITASNATGSWTFGASVAMTETKIVVGAWRANTPQGAIYTYNLDGTGEQYISVPGDHQIGQGVDIHGDKVITASRTGGSAFVFNTDGTGEVVLTSSDGTAGDQFGTTVAINSTKVVVGARYHSNYAGAVYVYNHDGSGEIKINYPGSTQYASFGTRLAMSENKILILDAVGIAWICNLDGTGMVQVSNETYHSISIASDKILCSSRWLPDNPQHVDIMDYTGSNLLRVNDTGSRSTSPFVASI
jgi:hypothetical protein